MESNENKSENILGNFLSSKENEEKREIEDKERQSNFNIYLYFKKRNAKRERGRH